jgi:hypothetical protein
MHVMLVHIIGVPRSSTAARFKHLLKHHGGA